MKWKRLLETTGEEGGRREGRGMKLKTGKLWEEGGGECLRKLE